MRRVKRIIELLAPPVLVYLYKWLIHSLLNKKTSNETPNDGKAEGEFKFISTMDAHKKRGDTLLILGNGPSLKQQLENSIHILTSNPCICVNSFASTDYYEQIKPCVYVLADPDNFHAVPRESIKELVENRWKDINDKTKWNIDLVIPARFRDSEQLEKIKSNTYINILLYNDIDCKAFSDKKTQFELFNKNELAIPAQTVLNIAVYLGIFWKYKNVFLLGADTSWHEDLFLDQKTNLLYLNQNHFYSWKFYSKKRTLLHEANDTPQKVHEQFFLFYNVFRLYWLLREYADFNSVSVYNASGKSWIDAFERKSLDEVYNINNGQI